MNGPEDVTSEEEVGVDEDEEEVPELTEAQLQQAMLQQLRMPIYLPKIHNILPLTAQDGSPGVLVETITPAGSQRVTFTRDEALAFASRIRKVAQTGPSEPDSKLVTPPGAGRLIVPGR